MKFFVFFKLSDDSASRLVSRQLDRVSRVGTGQTSRQRKVKERTHGKSGEKEMKTELLQSLAANSFSTKFKESIFTSKLS